MGTAEDLQRWVHAGLIDADTAKEIGEFEARRKGGRTVGRGTEAVAYLGVALVLVALGILAVELQDRIEPWGRFAVSMIVSVVLLVVGWLLGRSEEPAFHRAQAFAWFLAVGTVALAGGVLFGDFVQMDGVDVFLWVSVVALLLATVLWVVRPSSLGMVAMAGSAFLVTSALVGRLETVPNWSFGVAFAGLGVIWLLLTWGGILEPPTTSYTLSAMGILMVGISGGSNMPWPLLGLVASLALMGLSVRLDQIVLVGFGVAGLFVYVPMTIFELFGESTGVPVAMLLTGLVLLGVVVGAVQLRKGVRT